MHREIDHYIKKLSDNENVQHLLGTIFEKIFIKALNNEKFFKLIYENGEQIHHICDWVTSVVKNGEKWKEPRVFTIEALNNAADKYFEKKNNKIQTIELDEKHEKLIADLNDCYIVQMLTPEALDNESKQMQHCIGHGGYDRNLNNENYQYLSLRDKFNKAHITLEISEKNILQIQGKQNKLPELKYLNYILPWLIKEDIMVDLKNFDVVLNKLDGKIYKMTEMPENCDVFGDLNLRGMYVDKLPNGLIVEGNLCLSYSKIREIPDKILVKKNLEMLDCKKINKLSDNIVINGDFIFDMFLKKIPKSLRVDGNMIFENITFKQDILPDNLFKNEYLDLNDLVLFLARNDYKINLSKYGLIYNKNDDKIYSIYEMPENCIINNHLNLWGITDIDGLPNNLTIDGNLVLNYCDLENLPDDIKINGNLDLNNSSIKKIHKNVKVGGYILFYDLKFERKILPDDLFIENYVDMNSLLNFLLKENYDIDLLKHNLYFNKNDNKVYYIFDLPENSEIDVINELRLDYSKIMKLPDGFIVNGSVNLRGAKIEYLPKNFKVNGDLDLSSTNIKEIREDIKVNGSLNLSWSKIEKIEKVSNINGGLYLSSCENLTKIADNLVVNGDLYLNECMKLEKIPNNLTVNGTFSLSYLNFDTLPNDIKINGTLDLKNSKIKYLPTGLKIGGDLNLQQSQIKELPDNIQIMGELYLADSKIEKLPYNLKCKTIFINLDKVKLIKESMEFEKIEIIFKKKYRMYNREEFFDIIKKDGGLIYF